MHDDLNFLGRYAAIRYGFRWNGGYGDIWWRNSALSWLIAGSILTSLPHPLHMRVTSLPHAHISHVAGCASHLAGYIPAPHWLFFFFACGCSLDFQGREPSTTAISRVQGKRGTSGLHGALAVVGFAVPGNPENTQRSRPFKARSYPVQTQLLELNYERYVNGRVNCLERVQSMPQKSHKEKLFEARCASVYALPHWLSKARCASLPQCLIASVHALPHRFASCNGQGSKPSNTDPSFYASMWLTWLVACFQVTYPFHQVVVSVCSRNVRHGSSNTCLSFHTVLVLVWPCKRPHFFQVVFSWEVTG